MMKHVKKFESFRIKKNREEIIRESVLQVNDIYKVKTMIDIPQSFINAYVKKVKDTTGKNLRQFFGDVDIAEEVIKYVTLNFVDVDKIPGGAIMGGQTQAQTQAQGQPQVQVQTEPQAQMQPQVQAQPEGQAQGGEFEEPQGQSQAQGDEFEEPQGQAQGQSQGQAQGQSQGQAQGQSQDQTEEGEEELPL